MCSLRPMIVDLNLVSGQLDYMPAQNFSYEYIPEGCCMKVHVYQQMVIHNLMIVDGLLIADGTVVVLD